MKIMVQQKNLKLMCTKVEHCLFTKNNTCKYWMSVVRINMFHRIRKVSSVHQVSSWNLKHEKKLTKQYSSGSGYLQPPPPPSYSPLPPNSFSDTVFADLNLTHEHTPLDDHEYATLDQLSNDRGKTHNEVSKKWRKKKESEKWRKKMLTRLL